MLISLGYRLGVKCLEHKVNVNLTFEDTAKLFPKVVVYFTFPGQYDRPSSSTSLVRSFLRNLTISRNTEWCLIIFFLIFWPHPKACRILVPFALSKQCVLTIGSAGESAEFLNFNEVQFIELFPFMNFFFPAPRGMRDLLLQGWNPCPLHWKHQESPGHVLGIIPENSLPVLRI